MERKFRLLKDLPNIKAGEISYYHNNLFKFKTLSDNYVAFNFSELLDAPDWFEEIKEPEMVWQKPEMNKETASTLYYVSDDDNIYTGFNITEQTITWFSSKEQAETFAKHLKAGALLRAAIERVNVANGNWKPDWGNEKQIKHLIGFNNGNVLETQFFNSRMHPDCYYFGYGQANNVALELGDNATQTIKDFLMI
jgi:hypothetical protein